MRGRSPRSETVVGREGSTGWVVGELGHYWSTGGSPRGGKVREKVGRGTGVSVHIIEIKEGWSWGMNTWWGRQEGQGPVGVRGKAYACSGREVPNNRIVAGKGWGGEWAACLGVGTNKGKGKLPGGEGSGRRCWGQVPVQGQTVGNTKQVPMPCHHR